MFETVAKPTGRKSATFASRENLAGKLLAQAARVVSCKQITVNRTQLNGSEELAFDGLPLFPHWKRYTWAFNMFPVRDLR